MKRTTGSSNPGDVTIVLSWQVKERSSVAANRIDFDRVSLVKRFSLRHEVACNDGPRSSSFLRSILLSMDKTDDIEVHIFVTEEEAKLFPPLLEFIRSGRKVVCENKIEMASFVKLAKKLGVDTTDLVGGGSAPIVQTQSHKQPDAPEKLSTPRRSTDNPSPPSKPFNAGKMNSGQVLEAVLWEGPNQNPSQADPLVHEKSVTFDELPSLFQSILQANENEDEETKKTTHLSLSRLFDQTKQQDVMDIAKASGSIPCLLRILSDDEYNPYHLQAVTLIETMAKHSEATATRLVSYLAVETLLSSQILHPFEIRSHAIQAIGEMCCTKDLCLAVLAKDSCLELVSNALSEYKITPEASFTMQKFCFYAAEEIFSQKLLDLVANTCRSTRFSVYNNTCSSLLLLLTGGVNKVCKKKIKLAQTFDAIIFRRFSGPQLRGLETLWKLVSQQDYVLEALWEYNKCFEELFKALKFGSDRKIQALACKIMARLVRYARVANNEEPLLDSGYPCHYTFLMNDIFAILSKLVRYCGITKIPATQACVEMLRSSNLVSLKVTTESVSGLCDVLSSLERTKDSDKLLFGDIIMALQNILASDNPLRQEMHVLIGVKLAGVMTK